MCEHEEVYKLEAFKLFNTILKPYAEQNVVIGKLSYVNGESRTILHAVQCK